VQVLDIIPASCSSWELAQGFNVGSERGEVEFLDPLVFPFNGSVVWESGSFASSAGSTSVGAPL
jgi:hypothetical protein